jgi:Cof subfamily protein (haloacid dehalogenase superfamily)
MVGMIVMDLDGTLLTDEKNISNYTLSILQKCKNNHIKIVIATGRSEKASKRTTDLVKPDFGIFNGGALIKNGYGKVVYKKLLSVKTSDEIIYECMKNDNFGDITVETEEKYYVSYKTQPYYLDYMHGIYYDFSKPLSKETYKITSEIFDKKILPEINSKFDECKVIEFSGENWCGFYPEGTGKMKAIEIISECENISLSDIVAFGDDYNDIEMIKKSGIGIAMENGIEEIKKISDYICENNNKDGVGQWIEKNICLK